MRPDLEDYEELNATEEAPRSRAMSWLVLVVAVAGFACLAYYAYHSGTSNAENGDVLVVQADETPIKEVPTDPEGEQFANKDKTIYDVITPGSAANSEQGVEKLMPDPERPVSVHELGDEDSTNNPEPKTAANSTTTFVNKGTTPTVDPVDAQAAKQPAPKAAPQALPETASVQPSQASVAPSAAVTVTEAKPATAAAVGEPTFVNEVPVATKAKPVAEVKKPAEKKEAAKEVAKKPVATGSAQIQLGAFKTEEEAKTTWKKIQAKFAGTLGGSPMIVKADLPNGTFYRLRTSVASAKEACATLSAKGQACFPVK